MASGKLTNLSVQNASYDGKNKKLNDGAGLYLHIQKSGKYWRYDYSYAKKRKTLALGVFPEISLKDARIKHQAARKLLHDGIDPSEVKKAQKQFLVNSHEDNFESIALAWFENKSSSWVDDHSKRILNRLKADVFPYLGHRPMVEITTKEIVLVLQRVENRGAIETAHRLKGYISSVFQFGLANGIEGLLSDPAAIISGALKPVPKANHFAAITEVQQLSQLMRDIFSYQGDFPVECALRISPYLFTRPGEIVSLKWEDVNLETGELNFTPSKNSPPLISILPFQVLQILKELFPLTGKSEFIFESRISKSGHVNPQTLNAALKRMGYKGIQTAHGFRALARTILEEVLEVPIQYIEHQLTHSVKDVNGRAYNRTKYIKQRAKMLQLWADYLDECRESGFNETLEEG